MQSLTQATVAKNFNISRATVNRWVEQSQEGKNNLQLEITDKKVKILDNSNNGIELQRLAKTANKYKNSDLKKVTVNQDFYKIFSKEELSEIYTDLNYNKEINLKYGYKKAGADYWNDFYLGNYSLIKTSVDEMLDLAVEDILYHTGNNKKFNVIDIGPGNGHPVKNLLTRMIKENIMSKYIAVDISEDINNITINNLQSWFPNLECLSYQRDLEYGKVGNIFLENKEKKENDIILHIGNTFCNYSDRIQILKHLRAGMIPEDFLILSFTLSTNENKSALNYMKNDAIESHNGWMAKMLGIDVEKCEIIIEYNQELNCKTRGFKLDKDYQIEYDLAGKIEIINLKQGQIINTWKHHLIDTIQFIQEIRGSKLELVNLKTDKNGSNALAICRAV